MSNKKIYQGAVKQGGIRDGDGSYNYQISGMHPGNQIYEYNGPFDSGKKQGIGSLIIKGISSYNGEFKDLTKKKHKFNSI